MRNIDLLVFELCDTILRRADDVDFEAIEEYIQELENDEIRTLNNHSKAINKQTIRAIVRSKLFQYIDTYKDDNTGGSPFDFDTGRNYQDYVAGFETIYKKYNNSAQLPKVFTYVFDYIKEASEHYRFFEKFYKIREDDFTKTIDSIVQNVAERTIKSAADLAAESASTKAKESANNAMVSAEIAKEKANDAANNAAQAANEAVKNAVKDKMNDVTKTISETSITILGIFAGIVLTVVAGLFYSSSVLDNINSANFCRLVSISALVGFVCYSLIALMFRYIERIKYDKDKAPSFSKMTTVISCVLLAIMILFGVLQYFDADGTNNAVLNESVVDINVTTNKGETQSEAGDSNNTTEKNVVSDKNTPNFEENTNVD